MRQCKGDNRGLSLIEVLVAVMILGIIVTPFLHSFITAANANSDAKQIHKATVVAQSVMEGFKAEDLEELALQFNYPGEGFYVLASGRIGDGTNVAALARELRWDGSNYQSVVKYEDPSLSALADKRPGVTASSYSADMGATSEFLGQAGGVYYFTIEDVKEDVSSYDVLVKLDATDYRAGGSVEAAHRYNDVKLTQLPVIDLDQDAMSVQKEVYTDAAVAHFLATHTGITEAQLRADMTRVITITVDRIPVGTEYKTTVTTEYLYSYQSGSEIWKAPKKTQTSFDSLETGKDLRSVYLYYYPLYKNGAARDQIIFVNNNRVPLDFYLMKQASSTVTNENEEQYMMQLDFKETGATEATMATGLYTNLPYNLTSGSKVAVPLYAVTLNGGTINLSNITSENLLEDKVEDRMFDIEVSVYERGAAGAGFPEDMRLTTMEGSKVK